MIHNGIIENFAKLRAELEADGVEFASDTDTECAAHLLARELAALCGPRAPPSQRRQPLAEAMRRVCRRLEGAFTLLAVDADTPGVVVGARRNSPLVVGRGTGENFLASDVVRVHRAHPRGGRAGPGPGRPDHAGRASRSPTSTATPPPARTSTSTGTPPPPRRAATTTSCSRRSPSSRRRSPTPCAAGSATTGEIVLDEVRLTDQDLRDVDKIFIVACGTAYHAGLVAKYAIEHWTRIPCEVELASEFRYRDPVLDRSTLVVAISQSGETMDTLMALRHAKEQKARVLAICNTNGSTIPRESDAVLYTHAGPEIAVASTKAFLTQLVACYLVGLHLAQVRGIKYADEVGAVLDQLQEMPAAIEQVLETMEPVRELARGPGPVAVGAVHRPARRLPGGAGGRAQAQGAGLHARRGLRRRRAQARPDRADRRGHPGDLRRAVAGRPGRAARQGRLQHPGGTGPGRPHHRDRRGGRRGRPAVRRPPDRGAADARPCSRRWSPPCRCRCSPARSPPPAATTSTSPATWPSRSPSSELAREEAHVWTSVAAFAVFAAVLTDHARVWTPCWSSAHDGRDRPRRPVSPRSPASRSAAWCGRSPARSA